MCIPSEGLVLASTIPSHPPLVWKFGILCWKIYFSHRPCVNTLYWIYVCQCLYAMMLKCSLLGWKNLIFHCDFNLNVTVTQLIEKNSRLIRMCLKEGSLRIRWRHHLGLWTCNIISCKLIEIGMKTRWCHLLIFQNSAFYLFFMAFWLIELRQQHRQHRFGFIPVSSNLQEVMSQLMAPKVSMKTR